MENIHSQDMGEGEEGIISTGGRTDHMEERPPPPTNHLGRLVRDGPANNFPFTNLRLKHGIPGFPGFAAFRLDDECERRGGEYPWQPRPMEEEDEQEIGEGNSAGTGLKRLGTDTTNLLQSKAVRKEGETHVREERGKEKLEWVSRGQTRGCFDKGLMDDKIGGRVEFGGPGGSGIEPQVCVDSVGNRCPSITSQQLNKTFCCGKRES